MKTVTFKGVEYQVPSWAKWLAHDGFGVIKAYQVQPRILDNFLVSNGMEWIVGSARMPVFVKALA